jgi:hypothetical protein
MPIILIILKLVILWLCMATAQRRHHTRIVLNRLLVLILIIKLFLIIFRIGNSSNHIRR